MFQIVSAVIAGAVILPLAWVVSDRLFVFDPDDYNE